MAASAGASLLGAVPYSCAVSSTLDRNVTEFGKQHMFDGNASTCWSSHTGSPQYVSIGFDEPVRVSAVRLMFQGGFVGRECMVQTRVTVLDSWQDVCAFTPDDSNAWQTFAVPAGDEAVCGVRLFFGGSSDFYGRITIYAVDVLGTAAPA